MSMVSRDAYARQEIHRRTLHAKELYLGDSCDWCGCRNNHGGLFEYYIETDGGSKYEIQGQFCSVGCMKIFNE